MLLLNQTKNAGYLAHARLWEAPKKKTMSAGYLLKLEYEKRIENRQLSQFISN